MGQQAHGNPLWSQFGKRPFPKRERKRLLAAAGVRLEGLEIELGGNE
jgi:hypothetical protein